MHFYSHLPPYSKLILCNYFLISNDLLRLSQPIIFDQHIACINDEYDDDDQDEQEQLLEQRALERLFDQIIFIAVLQIRHRRILWISCFFADRCIIFFLIQIISQFFDSLTIKMVTQQFEQCIRHQNYDTLLTL